MMNYTYNENMVMADVENKTHEEIPNVLLVFDKKSGKLNWIDIFSQRNDGTVINFFYYGGGYDFFVADKNEEYKCDTEQNYYVEGNNDMSPKMHSVFD